MGEQDGIYAPVEAECEEDGGGGAPRCWCGDEAVGEWGGTLLCAFHLDDDPVEAA